MEGARSISIREAVDALPGPRQPKDLAVVNDSIVRVAQLEGEFPWHEHEEDEEDEVFLCWDGSFRIEMEGAEPVVLRTGELLVVPRGVRHRPVADEVPHALLIEKPETRQYGN